MWQRFTERARKVILLGQEEAQQMGSSRVDTEHLLLGLLREQEGVAAQVLDKSGVNVSKVRAEIEKEQESSPSEPPTAEPKLTPRSKRVLELAADEARRMKHNYIGTEHLLLGLLREKNGVAARVLRKFGLELKRARQEVMEYLGPEAQTPERSQRTPTLDAFCHDLMRLAAEGAFDPVIGREAEVQRVLEILCRRSKSNALLVGKVGVGKTAIVRGVAMRIACRQVPDDLMGTRIVHLDIPALLLGAAQGGVEKRLSGLVQEIRQLHRQGQPRAVIFLDDMQGMSNYETAVLHALFIHMAQGSLPCSCIATTTPEGFERMGEESVLRRMFQTVWVTEPTVEETLTILQTLRPRYAEFHRVSISDGALTAAVEGAHQQLPGALPEKALDVLDEACARVKVRTGTPPPEVAALMKEIEKVKAEKDSLIQSDEYERAAEMRDRQMELEQQLQQRMEAWQTAAGDTPPTVTEEEVGQVIAERANAQKGVSS